MINNIKNVTLDIKLRLMQHSTHEKNSLPQYKILALHEEIIRKSNTTSKN